MKSNDIINDLIRKITLGEINISSQIPSESQLAIKYDCNRHTIRKVLEYLIERGYIVKDAAGRAYVNDVTIYDNNLLFLSSMGDFINPENIRSDVLRFEAVKATELLAGFLKIEEGSKVWCIKRVRYVDSAPHHMEETFMPMSLFPGLMEKDCQGSLLSYIESQYDYKISHGIRNISAVMLTEEEGNLLNLPEKSLVMQIENTGYLTNGRVYEYSISKFRENKFSYYCRR